MARSAKAYIKTPEPFAPSRLCLFVGLADDAFLGFASMLSWLRSGNQQTQDLGPSKVPGRGGYTILSGPSEYRQAL